MHGHTFFGYCTFITYVYLCMSICNIQFACRSRPKIVQSGRSIYLHFSFVRVYVLPLSSTIRCNRELFLSRRAVIPSLYISLIFVLETNQYKTIKPMTKLVKSILHKEEKQIHITLMPQFEPKYYTYFPNLNSITHYYPSIQTTNS